MEPRQASDSAAERLARRSRSVDRSSIRLMFDLAQQQDADDLVHLEIGEPDFDTPDHIVSAATDAAERGETHYTSNAGLVELREAVATDMDERGVDADPGSEITVTTGAMEALLLAILSVADPGEEVVIPTPAWPNYRTQVKLADATPVELPLSPEDDFALDPERVERAIGEETAAVVLTSPSNPTGQVYEREAVVDVVETAAAHDAYVIADEVYADIVYGDQPTGIAGYVDGHDNVLTVDSCSKTYAMTGWRLGWLAGPERVIDAATKLHESTTACAPSVSQHAAIAALEGPEEPVDEMREAYRERRDYVVDRLADVPEVACVDPDGAFYAFVDVSGLGDSSLDIAKRLLTEYGVVTAPGSGFGDAGEGHLRMSFANDIDRLETGLDRFESFVRDERGE
jgi:aspartate aminotransferase